MSTYSYTDEDGDRLIIEAPGWPADTASVSTNGNAVFVKADEAPKAAQAILDAAGVQAVILTDLPKVLKTRSGNYVAGDFTSYHQSSLSVMEKELKAVTAIWLQRKADEADKLAQQIEEAAGFRANQARMEAENKAAAVKKAHDDLRTSPIALKALAIYNRGLIGIGPYASWDEVLSGAGCSDGTVRKYILQAVEQEAKEKEAAEKLAARRDELVQDHVGNPFRYLTARPSVRSLVDRIIELEDAK